MIDRRLVQNFDWGLVGITCVIAAAGLVALYSAVHAGATEQGWYFTRQLVWYAIGTAAMVVAFLFDYKAYERWGHLIYLASIVMLVAVLVTGKYVAGSRRWLDLGPFSLQPSEPAKLAVIIALARYYVKVATTDGLSLRELARPALITAVPFALIVKQPDLGTAMVIGLIAAAMTFFVKIQRRTLTGLVAAGTLSVPAVWYLLKEYQKQRILTFLNPERDPLGAGYHIIQSKIAIGSGMLTGRGFLKGPQNALDFLPEQHTDFIFSVLAEEWGLLGAGLMILLFFLLVAWGLSIAHRSRDPFGTLVAVGVTSMIAWQVFINIGMVMGMLPVVGVTLPFVSYGGSSILTVMIGIGLLLNISMRRFMHE